jgi:hypothetical protein
MEILILDPTHVWIMKVKVRVLPSESTFLANSGVETAVGFHL